MYNDQRIAKKKTHVKKRTLNPVFNEAFVFELPHLEEGLKNISLEFMLLDWDRVTKNEVRKVLHLLFVCSLKGGLDSFNLYVFIICRRKTPKILKIPRHIGIVYLQQLKIFACCCSIFIYIFLSKIFLLIRKKLTKMNCHRI